MTTTIHGTPLPRGQVQTEPDATAAECYPSTIQPDCHSCSRFRCGEPLPPEHRLNVVIDASTIRGEGECAMWSPGSAQPGTSPRGATRMAVAARLMQGPPCRVCELVAELGLTAKAVEKAVRVLRDQRSPAVLNILPAPGKGPQPTAAPKPRPMVRPWPAFKPSRRRVNSVFDLGRVL